MPAILQGVIVLSYIKANICFLELICAGSLHDRM